MVRKRSGAAGVGGTLLFAIQFVFALWPPFYNKAEPYWMGIPFFYWFQLLLVIVAAVLTAIVYFATERLVPQRIA